MNTKEWKEELNKLKIEYSKDSVLTFNGGYYGEIPDKASNDIDKFVSGLLKKAIDRAVDLALPNEKMVKEKDLCKQLYAEFNITNKEEESKVL